MTISILIINNYILKILIIENIENYSVGPLKFLNFSLNDST